MPKFTKGAPKPPNSGKRKGSHNKGTERARRLIFEADDKAIVDRVILGAKNGEPEPLRVYFRYLRPPTPRFLNPIDYTPPQSLEEARAAFLALGKRLMDGEIPLEAHDALIAGLKAYLGDMTAEQEKRLARLEDLLRDGEPP
jgi:hypothetical protein